MSDTVPADETFTPGDPEVKMGANTCTRTSLGELRRSERAKLKKAKCLVLRSVFRAHTRRSSGWNHPAAAVAWGTSMVDKWIALESATITTSPYLSRRSEPISQDSYAQPADTGVQRAAINALFENLVISQLGVARDLYDSYSLFAEMVLHT